jgi:hypothetical protein
MTPEFLEKLFIWKYDENKHGKEETCIPLQLQNLFSRLKYSKNKAIGTKNITKSFGWEGRDVFQQRDVQELFQVLFDAVNKLCIKIG